MQTFYCPEIFNISRIIKCQSELKILGLYARRFRHWHIRHASDGPTRNILKTLKELHNSQLFFPIVFTLDSAVLGHISIFPAFYSVDRCATIHQVLAQSFCKDQGKYMVAKADNITQLSIYLIDSSDIPSITALAKNMSVFFPRIRYLNLCFKRRCEIVSFLIVIDDYNRI